MITQLLLLIVFIITIRYFTKRPHNFPPGPTGIPGLGYLPFLRRPIHKTLRALSNKYGKIVGIYLGNYPTVLLNDRKLALAAYKDERLSARPSFPLLAEITFGKRRGITTATGKPWQEQRRFAMKNLRTFGIGKKSMEEVIMEDVVDLISGLKNDLDVPISLASRFNLAVLNSFWHILAGERFSYDDPKLQNLMMLLHSAFNNISITVLILLVPQISKVVSGSEVFVNTLRRTHDFIKDAVDAHRKTLDVNNLRDFIDAYLAEIKATTDPESTFYKEEGELQLLAVLTEFFMAGGTATSVALNWLFLHLITFPNVQEKVQREIDSVVGRSRYPSLNDLPDMPYTQAVIAESLRFSTVGSIGPLHSNVEEMDLEGYTLPKDTVVIASVWLFHNDKKYWGDPQNFRPERFITDDGVYNKGEGLFLFSGGKRACPGESLVYDEMFLILSGLLQRFSFERDGKVMPSLEAKSSMLTVTPDFYQVITRERNEF